MQLSRLACQTTRSTTLARNGSRGLQPALTTSRSSILSMADFEIQARQPFAHSELLRFRRETRILRRLAVMGPLIHHPSELSRRRAWYFVPQHYLDVHTGIDQIVDVVDELLPLICSKRRCRDYPDFPAAGSYLGDLGFLDVLQSLECESEHRRADERAIAAENPVLPFSGNRLDHWKGPSTA